MSADARPDDEGGGTRAPERVVRAPGRVNLIGGQVDYHDGLVVSAALDQEVRVRARARDDGRIRVRSDSFDGLVDVAGSGADDVGLVEPSWGRLVAAVVSELAARGHALGGFDAEVTSSLPIGAGLGSSAAFEVAVALTCCEVAGVRVERRELARACQSAELVATGVPCGLQDQLTSLFGIAGAGILVDCRDLTITPVPIPPEAAIVVVHSGVARTLADSAWAQRRAESLAVAASLGLTVLRDASIESVEWSDRGRHVVSEIARVESFAAACALGDVATAGRLMVESHVSSRDDMAVSVPELDLLVDLLVARGAYGARLTGGGFGGCVVALAPRAQARAIAADASAAYASASHRTPTSWVTEAVAGAGPEAVAP